MATPKVGTHIEVVPRSGKVEFHIQIDERATITADADLTETQQVLQAIEGEVDDDEVLLIDKG